MSNVKDTYLTVRVSKDEKELIESFAKDVYGFNKTSELLRHALDYVLRTRPVLGKRFAPGSANG